MPGEKKNRNSLTVAALASIALVSALTGVIWKYYSLPAKGGTAISEKRLVVTLFTNQSRSFQVASRNEARQIIDAVDALEKLGDPLIQKIQSILVLQLIDSPEAGQGKTIVRWHLDVLWFPRSKKSPYQA